MGKLATIKLRDIAHGGDAVGSLDGKAVFVPFGIPGETVRVEITREYARHLMSRLLDVVEPSPERVQPPCPHFGVCGGCQWQHIAYTRQLELKRQIVQAQMERIARLQVQVLPVIGMPDPWSYRNNIQYGVAASGELGFMAHHSHVLVPISECWIAHPRLEDLAGAFDLQDANLVGITLRVGAATGEELVLFEGEEEPEISVDMPVSCVFMNQRGEVHVLAGDSSLRERLNQRLWRVSAPSFFQVNTEQAEHLVRKVLERLPGGPGTLVDAYCGVGTFALSLADRYEQVIGIEESPWAIEDAQVNRGASERVAFYEGSTEELLPGLLPGGSDVVLDPPRAGCAPTVLQALIAAQTRHIVYVSCDPATLARDLGTLARAGYQVGEIQPVDMFPQTGHVECVVSLTRSQNA